MNKQELLKQADYNFQRGNRELAKKYLADLLARHPQEEAAWVLLARVVEEKERKIECLERVLRINPNNTEAKINLTRLKTSDKTLPLHVAASPSAFVIADPIRNILRSAAVILVLFLVFGTTTYVFARNNPESRVAKLILPATPTPLAQPLADDIAPQTRAEVGAQYPEYVSLVDTLISFAVNNAEGGMEGAPERPGAPIMTSELAAAQAKSAIESALPPPGSLNTATLTEQQVTSWLALEMQNSPDLPLHDIQVYLRDGEVQVWGVVEGSNNSTSALVTGKINLDTDGIPVIEVDSLQIGQQVIPDILLPQVETWLNQMLLESINRQVPGLKIMNINISSGLITVSGMR
ncbi:MAG: hypothetical protein K8S20_13425 [Chloroflexi bacterium]|nr:hypothetical protein [Chloroflexota bacterium]